MRGGPGRGAGPSAPRSASAPQPTRPGLGPGSRRLLALDPREEKARQHGVPGEGRPVLDPLQSGASPVTPCSCRGRPGARPVTTATAPASSRGSHGGAPLLQGRPSAGSRRRPPPAGPPTLPAARRSRRPRVAAGCRRGPIDRDGVRAPPPTFALLRGQRSPRAGRARRTENQAETRRGRAGGCCFEPDTRDARWHTLSERGGGPSGGGASERERE